MVFSPSALAASSVQVLDQHETRAVRHAGGFSTPFARAWPGVDRHVDIGDSESLAFHHDQGKDKRVLGAYFEDLYSPLMRPLSPIAPSTTRGIA